MLTTKNYANPQIGQVNQSPDAPGVDDSHLVWDRNGNVKAGFVFAPTADLVPGAEQQIRVRLRKTAAGPKNPNWRIRIEEDGFQKGGTSASLDLIGYTDTDWVTHSFKWDAAVLSDLSGAEVVVWTSQVAGGIGNPADRRGIEISAIEWIAVVDPDNPRTEVLSPVSFGGAH